MAKYAESGTVAEIVRHDGGPDGCVIVRQPGGPSERVTVWVAAQEGSFVSLDEIR